MPAVAELGNEGTDLVMERIDGPSMVAALGRSPWTVRQQAKTLAALHQRLHEIDPPDFLAPSPVGSGDCALHLDLHPLNVITGANGPVVIDWTGACTGDGAVDVGLALVLMSAGEIPGGRVKAKALGWGRSQLVNGFASHFDRTMVARQLRAVVEWKVKDPHMGEREVQAMWRVVERDEARA